MFIQALKTGSDMIVSAITKGLRTPVSLPGAHAAAPGNSRTVLEIALEISAIALLGGSGFFLFQGKLLASISSFLGAGISHGAASEVNHLKKIEKIAEELKTAHRDLQKTHEDIKKSHEEKIEADNNFFKKLALKLVEFSRENTTLKQNNKELKQLITQLSVQILHNNESIQEFKKILISMNCTQTKAEEIIKSLKKIDQELKKTTEELKTQVSILPRPVEVK